MKPEYVLSVNAVTVTNWSDLQLACECTQAIIQALAVANSRCSLGLKRIELGVETRYLIEAEIAGGNYDMTLVKVEWKQGAFIEL
jgi:hypothetical protein